MLAAVMLICSVFSVSIGAYAAEELRYFERGVLTDGTHTAYYIIDKDNKVLYITGDGNHNAETPDYPSADEGPFAGRTDVTRIVIEEDVAKIGDYALSNMKKVDTLEVQSNLLSSSSSMSSKAMIGCTGLRHIQGDSALLSTDVFLEVVKGAVNIASGNWLSLIKNGISIVSTGVSGDDTLDNDTVHCMVDDYINNGEKIFLGDLEQAQEEYQERLENPCYSNNAFHHDYFDFVLEEPTCTVQGERKYMCGQCGNSYTVPIEALGHDYRSSVLYQPSCFTEGITKYACTRCKQAVYEAIPAFGHHTYDILDYDAAGDAYTEICSVCQDHNTEFDNDISVLIAAADMAENINAADYTTESYDVMDTVANRYYSLNETDYLQYPQNKVDDKIAEILTSIDALVPYLNLQLSYSYGGSASVSAQEVTTNAGKRSLVFGTEVTLTATPSSGYTFIGWYEKTTKRYLSTEETYTFSMSSNMDVLARFTSSNDATLYFECLDGQIKAYVNKTVEEWNTLDSVEAILPDIPYSYGYTNGRWEYDNGAVLAALRSGQDVTVRAVYDEKAVTEYAKPSSEGSIPAVSLYYEYDETANVGNFIMMGDIPQACQYEEIGIAFYYKKSGTFNPAAFRLTLNNKMVTSRFTAVADDGQYVVNFKKMNSGYDYAARGYVTYYDADGALKVVYTNQINVVDLVQTQ